jgi:hypothetical protein
MPCVPTMLNINVDRQLIDKENQYFDNKKQKLFQT